MSLITLNHYDFEALFYLATEPEYRLKLNEQTQLCINTENVCSVTSAKYGTNSLRRRGPGGVYYVFLPVRISMVSGEMHEVNESMESVVEMLKQGMQGRGPRRPNRGYTVDPENSELIRRDR